MPVNQKGFQLGRVFRRLTWRIDQRLLLIVIAAVVGSLSGLSAVVLNEMLFRVYHALKPLHAHWGGFLLPALGAALSCVFLGYIMREGSGHGVPEVIYAVSKRCGLLRLRSSFSRLISSTLTIASGGSAGPEAPVVISGASIGSNIAKKFALNDRQRIVIVGCGAAGAISSIFNAPVAGMIFAVEVILGDWTPISLIPIAIASVMGAEVSRLLEGNQIPFTHHAFHAGLLDIIACVGLGLVAGLASVLFTRLLHTVGEKSHKWIRLDIPRAALGGACVGLLGLFLPVVLGEGYEVVRSVIENRFEGGLLLAAGATLAKILATSLTIGSGGSGGIFAPCLVIGSLGGLAYERALVFLWPGVPWAEGGLFALLGMAGVMSGTLQAPLTGIFLIVEVTGGYEVMLPLILVSAVSATLCHYMEPVSFYHKELAGRGQLLRPRTDAGLLADLSVLELLEKDCVVVSEDTRLRDMISIIQQSRRDYFPVENAGGDFVGLVHLNDLRPYIFNPVFYDAVVVGELVQLQIPHVSPFDDLRDILDLMDRTRSWSLPVVHRKKYLGMVSKGSILDQYRKELVVQSY